MNILNNLAIGAFCILMLSACTSGSMTKEAKYPTGADRSFEDDIYKEPDSIFGKDGLGFGIGKSKTDASAVSGITVNSYLWRAALETVSFMPLASADPFGGVILTDWYSPEGVPNERFKLNVFILDKTLRSDAVQVKVFSQQKTRGGSWRDTSVAEETARKLEDTILTRARRMRVSQMAK